MIKLKEPAMALRRWGSETEMNLSAGSALRQRGRPSKTRNVN